MNFMRALAALLVAALLGGCYTLGETKPSMMRNVTTLAVPVSKNKTLEPNVEALLADTIVKKLQNDGTYTITSESRADAVVNTTLLQVTREAARSVRGNVLATSEYRLVTRIGYEVVEQSTGRKLLFGEVAGRTSFFVGSDIQNDEIQALPLAFADAAVSLASQLSEGF